MTHIVPASPNSGEAPIIPELVTGQEIVDHVYARSGLDEALMSYAFPGEPSDQQESSVTSLLPAYGQDVAMHAVDESGTIDVELIRYAATKLHDGMEQACRAKYGPVPPRTALQSILQKYGIVDPVYRSHIAGLDDRFWEIQFSQELAEQSWEKRLPGESQEQFVGRYVAGTLYRFYWAPYSYVR